MRLYNKYIQGAEIKDVKTLHEEAMAVPLYRETRKELQIDQKDISMQQFRLALCVTCGERRLAAFLFAQLKTLLNADWFLPNFAAQR